jgi:hypothetical protein
MELGYMTTQDKLIELMHDFRLEQWKLTQMEDFMNTKKHVISFSFGRNRFIPGISHTRFLATKEIKGGVNVSYGFYIYFRVDPAALLAGHRTLELFTCTPENVQRFRELLQSSFFDILKTHPYISNMDRWYLRRIDYTHDVRCENVPFLIALIKRTDKWYGGKYKGNGRNPSLEKRFTAYKFIVYDKQSAFKHELEVLTKKLPYERKNDDIEEIQGLIDSADNILRIECQCRSNKISDLKDKYGLDKQNRSFMPMMSEEIGENLLKYAYVRTIGTGDFYKFNNDGKKRISQSHFQAGTKQKLRLMMMLCGRSRHVLEARRQFTGKELIMIRDGRRQYTFNGKAEEFRNILRKFESIGMQPVPIPRDWYTEKPYGDIPNVFNNPIPNEWK